jgi:hypothetical protein
MTTLAVYSATRLLGEITLDGKRLTGSTPALQNVADVVAQRAGGDVAKAYAALTGWTNGYLTITTAPAAAGGGAQAAAWDPAKHRRKNRGQPGGGEFTDTDGAGLPPVPDLSKMSRDQLITLLADQAGWVVDHNLGGHPEARERLRAIRDALHAGPAGQAPGGPRPGTPEALLASMTGNYDIEPGVPAAQKQHIAAALARLPAPVRQDIKNYGTMRQVSIRQHNWQTEAPEGTVTAIGSYNTDSRTLTISADSGDAAQTAVHESLHAWDRGPTGAPGRFSRQPDFTAIAGLIRDAARRHPRLADPHYAPAGAPPGRLGQRLLDAGNAEMFAELGADYLAGYPYNLHDRGSATGALPPPIRARLDAYYTGVFHIPRKPARRTTAAAADAADLTALSCVRTTNPPSWLFTTADGTAVSPETGEPAAPGAAAAASRTDEARGPDGRWIGGDAHGRFFHGTRATYEPGRVLSGQVHYYTGYRPQAASYAQGATQHGPARVYQVEPIEGHERDPEYPDTGEKVQWPPGGAWRARKVRVIREVSHSEMPQPEDTPAV